MLSIPEYIFGKNVGPTAVNTYSVPKTDFIQMNKEKVLQMDQEIEKLEEEIKSISDTQSEGYKMIEKKLSVRRRIKADCESAIQRTKMQMEIAKKTTQRYR